MRTFRRFLATGWPKVPHLGAAVIASLAVACNSSQAVLTQQVQAERLASTLHIEFAKGNEATNLAVLADTDDASKAAAQEAATSMTAAAETLARLIPLVESLGYATEKTTAEQFGSRFAELKTLDSEILPLAVENTNLKAQRLSFDDGQSAVDAAVKALREADGSGTGEPAVLVERIIGALREIQVLEARHIAESNEAAMGRMEAQMHEAEGVALRGMSRLRHLSGTSSPDAGKARQAGDASLDRADQAIEQFLGVNQQIVDLSRRNTNVRSLALTLGRRRVVAAECEDLLRTLETAVSSHQFRATR